MDWRDWLIARVPGLSLEQRLELLRPDDRYSKYMEVAIWPASRYNQEQFEQIAKASLYPIAVKAMIATWLSFDLNPDPLPLSVRLEWLSALPKAGELASVMLGQYNRCHHMLPHPEEDRICAFIEAKGGTPRRCHKPPPQVLHYGSQS